MTEPSLHPNGRGLAVTRPGLLALVCVAAAIAALLGAGRAQAQYVPYFPTPEAMVDRMLKVAEVTESDYLIDLGCGDGRIPVTAAQRYRARGLGVDFDAQRIVEAEENARKAGVTGKVMFRKEDLFDTDISQASVLTLYLSLKLNIKLRPRILKAMKPGTRVLSNEFNMGDWLPDKTERVDGRVFFLWIVPAKVAGNWRVSSEAAEGPRSFEVALQQQFQELSGAAVIDGKAVPVRDGLVTGERVAFVLDMGPDRLVRFEGRLVDGHLEGKGWKGARK